MRVYPRFEASVALTLGVLSMAMNLLTIFYGQCTLESLSRPPFGSRGCCDHHLEAVPVSNRGCRRRLPACLDFPGTECPRPRLRLGIDANLRSAHRTGKFSLRFPHRNAGLCAATRVVLEYFWSRSHLLVGGAQLFHRGFCPFTPPLAPPFSGTLPLVRRTHP